MYDKSRTTTIPQTSNTARPVHQERRQVLRPSSQTNWATHPPRLVLGFPCPGHARVGEHGYGDGDDDDDGDDHDGVETFYARLIIR